jgi:hypothetical protein
MLHQWSQRNTRFTIITNCADGRDEQGCFAACIFQGFNYLLECRYIKIRHVRLHNAKAACLGLVYAILGLSIIGCIGSSVGLWHAASTCWWQNLSGK